MLNYELQCIWQVSPRQRELSGHIEDAKRFLNDWLITNSNQKCIKNDYTQLAVLSLLFLGGTLPPEYSNNPIRAPGAYHHARWMSQVLYTIKIALLRNQLSDIFEDELLESITSLALFLSVFYSKMWLSCSNTVDAPVNDLIALKTLTNITKQTLNSPSLWPIGFHSFAQSSQKKLENHLSYLSERISVFALFSDKLSDSNKRSMKKEMMKHLRSTHVTPEIQQMPFAINFTSKSLRNFIGGESKIILIYWILIHHSSLFLSTNGKIIRTVEKQRN